MSDGSMQLRRPNAFIVGAPKCGTTSMYAYLRQHPQIFMSRQKEIYFFSTDFGFGPEEAPTDMGAYLEHFDSARDEAIVGEGSVSYLPSHVAAQNICGFEPTSKIIVMLRNPVDVAYSLHSQLRYVGAEDEPDLLKALDAEQRRRSEGLPLGRGHLRWGDYSEILDFARQIRRCRSVFPSDQIHIVIYEQFVTHTSQSYRETLNFLGVDASFKATFSVENPNKTVRSNRLKKLVSDPPTSVANAARIVMPPSARRAAAVALMRVNTKEVPRPPLDPDLRRTLERRFGDQVDDLSVLLDRDLSSWRQAL